MEDVARRGRVRSTDGSHAGPAPLIPATKHHMERRYCPTCGTEADASSNFCGACGNALPGPAEPELSEASAGGPTVRINDALAEPAEAGLPGQEQPLSQQVLPYRVPLGRVLLMVILSGGLYQYYWFYLTWAQYRDHTRTEVFPVWHALCLLVPVYGLFRVYAHIEAFKQLMDDHGVENTLSPGWAVAAILSAQLLGVVSVLVTGGLGSEPEISRSTIFTQVVFLIMTLIIMLSLLLHVQGNINHYWSSRLGATLLNARTGAGELTFAALGVLVWVFTIMALVNPVTPPEGQFNDEQGRYGQQAAGYGIEEKVVAGDYDDK